MISRYTVRAAGKQMAQDAGPGDGPLGVQLLLTDPTDYNLAVLQALGAFTTDRPNERVVDTTAGAGGFRLVLAGTGALAGLTGPDAWLDGFSSLLAFWRNWSTARQGAEPIDPNTYRVVRDPGGKIVLELMEESAAASEAVRLAFTSPHTLTESPNTVTAPAAAPAVALAAPAAAGNVDDGAHGWAYTWVTAQGETTPSAATSATVVNKSINGQVVVTVPAAAADQGVTGARVYRTVAGGGGNLKLVGALTTNGGPFTDNVADAGLGADAPATNTAHGVNSVPDGFELALATLAGAMILQLAANKAAQNTGNTGLPNDVVDRRSMSDQYMARARSLREQYGLLVGKAAKADLRGASAIKDLDVSAGSGLGFLWHQRRNR
jgi:hypothetical protein